MTDFWLTSWWGAMLSWPSLSQALHTMMSWLLTDSDKQAGGTADRTVVTEGSEAREVSPIVDIMAMQWRVVFLLFGLLI
jgi:hypothetical protein